LRVRISLERRMASWRSSCLAHCCCIFSADWAVRCAHSPQRRRVPGAATAACARGVCAGYFTFIGYEYLPGCLHARAAPCAPACGRCRPNRTKSRIHDSLAVAIAWCLVVLLSVAQCALLGAGCSVPGVQCAVLGAHCRVPGAGRTVPSARRTVPGARRTVPGAQCPTRSAQCPTRSAQCPTRSASGGVILGTPCWTDNCRTAQQVVGGSAPQRSAPL
jgi:hypothetical protein